MFCRSRCKLQICVKERLNAKISQRRTKENRCQLPFFNLFFIKFAARSFDKFNFLQYLTIDALLFKRMITLDFTVFVQFKE